MTTEVGSLIHELDGQLLDGLFFCAKAYALLEILRAEPGGVERLQLRKARDEKRLLDEILPICRYVQTYYKPGRYISVRWLNGSQSYDAEIVQSGDYVTHGYYAQNAFLETTSAMHPNEHWAWTLLNQGITTYAPEGIDAQRGTPLTSEPVVFTNSEHVLGFAPIVVSSIRKKMKILYPENTSLVVQCHLNNLYIPSEWQLLVSEVEREIAATPFREVLLVDSLTQHATPLAVRVL
ncbi:GAF domain-containing protein [Pseudomonas jessenii]|uniref:hypothetical protein n=1 Tax=Pseudomonas jessenii TaxID=77298 RepID=UPI000FA1CBB9